MKTSTQVVGALMTMAAVFAMSLLPMEPSTKALSAGLVIAVGGGTMAFLRSRKSTHDL